MANTFDIYFHNLNDKAQREYLDFMGMDEPEYTETAPIAVVVRAPVKKENT